MTLNKKVPFFFRNLLAGFIVTLALGCAVPQKPQGGPRDRIPPKLLKATPADQTHNFSAKQIQLDFDKYFKLNNQYQEITISPNQDKPPEFKIKQKSLIITFKDTLLKNTTYVINFGKAIVDLNEGNLLKNFTYVFSTGQHIDSLSISGSVTSALTKQKEKDVTVMLLTLKQDSLLFGKKKPPVYTTTDTAGNFTLGNLHEGVYKLYALKETSPNKIYDNDNEFIGFLNSPLHLQNDTANIQLVLSKPIPVKFRLVVHKFDADGKIFLSFNKGLNNPSIKVIYPAALDAQKVVEFTKKRDSAYVYMKNMDFDSLRLAVFDNNKPLDTTYLHKGRKESFSGNVSLAYNVADMLKPGSDVVITSNTPITSYDQSLITLNEDSTAIHNFTLQKDTGIGKTIRLKYRWKQNVTYGLTFNEGAITGFFGDKNKRLFKRFRVDKPDNYSQLILKVTVPDTTHAYIVELLNDQDMVLRSDPVKKNTVLTYKDYLIGKYKIRIIYDTNGNGKWDPGNIKEKRQPENIWIYSKPIILRANWDEEEPLVIPPEFSF
jgi:hypothetical protein